MIRHFQNTDMEPVLDVWLRASIEAHHFVAPAFWHAQLDAMRRIYLPSATTRVFEERGAVIGFCSVHGDTLAALFVLPDCQGRGIGKRLLADAKARTSTLELTVYAANLPSIRFYESQGFETLDERLDEHTGHLERVMRWEG